MDLVGSRWETPWADWLTGMPVEGRTPAVPVEGRAAAVPVEGRAPTLPVEGPAPPEPQPRASVLRAEAEAPGDPLLLSRLWSGCHFFCPLVDDGLAPAALVWAGGRRPGVVDVAIRG